MLPIKPYLLHAYHKWIIDSGCTPLIVIDANHPRCNVPKDYVANGEIVFNVAPTAVRDMNIDGTSIDFKASFSGIVHLISAPIKAVIGIYAEENGEGIFFDMDDEIEEGAIASVSGNDEILAGASSAAPSNGSSASSPGPEKQIKGKPFLKLVE